MPILGPQSSIQTSLSREASKAPDPGARLHSSCSLTIFVVKEQAGKVAVQVFPLECELRAIPVLSTVVLSSQGAGTSKVLKNMFNN